MRCSIADLPGRSGDLLLAYCTMFRLLAWLGPAASALDSCHDWHSTARHLYIAAVSFMSTASSATLYAYSIHSCGGELSMLAPATGHTAVASAYSMHRGRRTHTCHGRRYSAEQCSRQFATQPFASWRSLQVHLCLQSNNRRAFVLLCSY
jgi:hypothetical protein